MITHRYAARRNETIPPLVGGKGRAADQWNMLCLFQWIPHGISLCWARVLVYSSPVAFSLPAASRQATHYHLSSNDSAWQWMHRRVSVNFIDEWHLKAGFNAFPKAFGPCRGEWIIYLHLSGGQKHNLALVPASFVGGKSAILMIH